MRGLQLSKQHAGVQQVLPRRLHLACPLCGARLGFRVRVQGHRTAITGDSRPTLDPTSLTPSSFGRGTGYPMDLTRGVVMKTYTR